MNGIRAYLADGRVVDLTDLTRLDLYDTSHGDSDFNTQKPAPRRVARFVAASSETPPLQGKWFQRTSSIETVPSIGATL